MKTEPTNRRKVRLEASRPRPVLIITTRQLPYGSSPPQFEGRNWYVKCYLIEDDLWLLSFHDWSTASILLAAQDHPLVAQELRKMVLLS